MIQLKCWVYCLEEKYVVYEGCSFNVVIGVLQGALLIPFTFRLLQPFEVFSFDGNTLFKSQNPFCKGREVGFLGIP